MAKHFKSFNTVMCSVSSQAHILNGNGSMLHVRKFYEIIVLFFNYLKTERKPYPNVIYVFYSGSLIKKPRKNKTVAVAAMQQNKKKKKNEEVPEPTLLVL